MNNRHGAQSGATRHFRRYLVRRVGDVNQPRIGAEACKRMVAWYRANEPSVRLPRSVRRSAGRQK